MKSRFVQNVLDKKKKVGTVILLFATFSLLSQTLFILTSVDFRDKGMETLLLILLPPLKGITFISMFAVACAGFSSPRSRQEHAEPEEAKDLHVNVPERFNDVVIAIQAQYDMMDQEAMDVESVHIATRMVQQEMPQLLAIYEKLSKNDQSQYEESLFNQLMKLKRELEKMQNQPHITARKEYEKLTKLLNKRYSD